MQRFRGVIVRHCCWTRQKLVGSCRENGCLRAPPPLRATHIQRAPPRHRRSDLGSGRRQVIEEGLIGLRCGRLHIQGGQDLGRGRFRRRGSGSRWRSDGQCLGVAACPGGALREEVMADRCWRASSGACQGGRRCSRARLRGSLQPAASAPSASWANKAFAARHSFRARATCMLATLQAATPAACCWPPLSPSAKAAPATQQSPWLS